MTRFANATTVTRLVWLLLPLTLGPSLGDALDDSTRAVQVTASTLAWGAWAALLVAVLIPRTVSLTAIRVAAPVGLGLASWAALQGERGLGDTVGVTWAALTAVVVFAPGTGEAFVNGSSYGDERRLPLRAPAALLLGPMQLAWVAAVAAPIGAPLLLAAEQWVPGAAAVVVGAPAAWVSTRALHGLARRWLVFVPAGLVVHDLYALVDPVLLPRAAVARFGPALQDSPARDLTAGAIGVALELELREPLEIAPRRRDRTVQVEPVEGVLVAPTRPAEVLREATRRHFALA